MQKVWGQIRNKKGPFIDAELTFGKEG